MKNIYIEGIQGMGKSTLANHIAKNYPQYSILREGDYSQADLAWCTRMTKKEYEDTLEKYPLIKEEIVKKAVEEDGHFSFPYTTILTDYPGFHKEMEQYEIYNGRYGFEEWKEIVFSRYKRMQSVSEVYECAFFQNIMEELMLFHEKTDDEIVMFYKELLQQNEMHEFVLFYLNGDVTKSIEAVRKERVDGAGREMWYPFMEAYYLDAPFGRRGKETLVEHLCHRQQVELRIIEEVLKEKAIVLPAKEWTKEQIEEGI